ncbi:hypothetical protein [Actinotalea sp. Marseille-Q4924]|uniref:hypothetical protein n=1 Tax=Actinotalea sp. Marseille-Q4924 TaxID=2866571 RepID=UPI001CE3EE75|nr:hypothetical protein [Actinotalea sp. Marseille-Q4924]
MGTVLLLTLLTTTFFVLGRQAQPRRERRPLRDLGVRDVAWTAVAGVLVLEHLHEVWVTRGGPGTGRSSASSA